jgi:hypothetical protein
MQLDRMRYFLAIVVLLTVNAYVGTTVFAKAGEESPPPTFCARICA